MIPCQDYINKKLLFDKTPVIAIVHVILCALHVRQSLLAYGSVVSIYLTSQIICAQTAKPYILGSSLNSAFIFFRVEFIFFIIPN